MWFKAMKSHAEQLKKKTTIQGAMLPLPASFNGGGTLHQRSLHTLLSPAMHCNIAQTTKFTYVGFGNTFLQLLYGETPDSATN